MTSIIIPTRDRPALLERCLDAVSRQEGLGEVVVVDDGSRPEAARRTRDIVRDLGFRLLINERSLGPAAARNRGWRAASGALIAFTDDDCMPARGWLAALSSSLVETSAQTAGVGGRVSPATRGVISDYMTLHRILEPPRSLSYLVTANCAFRRGALEAAGGFDASVKTPGGEDPGLCFALRRLGYGFVWAPEAEVYHHYREHLGDFLRTFYRYGRGCRVVMDR